ncbi:MAG: transposase [Ruminococcaceae bacterium]|nr:transposase [Oscillospiraceae bacterium]
MARQKRAKSETGIYHVMLRGINKQQVFYDNDDYCMFIDILSKVKNTSGFKLYAYCLMNNHVHLLIQEGDEPLEKVFQRFGDAFIYWYNIKYDRIGGIFQGRYKSIPVNDDEYFISVLRYIHQNPVKAGIAKRCSDYEFSSYNAYFNNSHFVNTGFALELIGVSEFKRIHTEMCDAVHLDISDEPNVRISDALAKQLILRRTGCASLEEFKQLPIQTQKEYSKYLRKEGIAARQIMRLTGVSQRIALSED